MGLLTRKEVEILKCCLMGHPSRSIEDRGTKCESMNYVELAQEYSEGKNFSVLPRNHSCDILVKEMTAFCPCPKSLPEGNMKNFGLIPLAEEISKKA